MLCIHPDYNVKIHIHVLQEASTQYISLLKFLSIYFYPVLPT